MSSDLAAYFSLGLSVFMLFVPPIYILALELWLGKSVRPPRRLTPQERIALIAASETRHTKGFQMNRRAFTLIELLVVVVIALSITAIAITVFVPSNQDRAIRATSDMVTGAMAQARSLAINTGRPAGVLLERDAAFPGGVIQLSFVEIPPPYAGGVIDARIHVGEVWVTDSTTTGTFGTPDAGDEFFDANENGALDWGGDGQPNGIVWAITDQQGNPDESWRGLIRPGDFLEINYRRIERYMISTADSNVDAGGYIEELGPTADTCWNLTSVDARRPIMATVGAMLPPLTQPPFDRNDDGDTIDLGEAGGAPFLIVRQPERSSVAPIQLPATAAIDLTASSADGYALDLYPGDVTILFTPGGNVQNVILEGDATNPPVRLATISPIYLLAGVRAFIPQNIAPQAGEPTYAFQDLRSRWIGINPVSGMVSSASPTVVDPTLPVGTLAEKWQRIVESRHYIQDSPGVADR